MYKGHICICIQWFFKKIKSYAIRLLYFIFIWLVQIVVVLLQTAFESLRMPDITET